MDAVKMLTEDHRLFRALFKRYRAARTPQQQEDLARRLIHEARIHLRLEEKYVSPIARHRSGVGLDEPTRVKVLLAELERMGFEDARFAERLGAFGEELLARSDEEERRCFPALRRAMRRGEFGALGRLIQNARETRSEQSASLWSRARRHLVRAWKVQIGNTLERLYAAALGAGAPPSASTHP